MGRDAAPHSRLQKVRLADGSVMRLDRRLSAADVVAASMLFAAGQFANTLRVNTALDTIRQAAPINAAWNKAPARQTQTHNAVQPRHDQRLTMLLTVSANGTQSLCDSGLHRVLYSRSHLLIILYIGEHF